MAERTTTMMDQYKRIKARHRDAVLFFRLGDFYEMFFEDAIEASAILDLTLTQRQGEPMCGVPYHAARSYIARLLKHGKKIAVCEQFGESGGKGIVERDVVEVVTPGTTLDEDFLEQGENNYIVAACALKDRLCLAYLDVSTGDFRAYSRPLCGGIAALLRGELGRLGPREMILQQSLLEEEGVAQALEETEGLVVNKYPDWSFDERRSAEEIAARFRVSSLKGFGFGEGAPEMAAAGALLRYVDETARSAAPHITPPLPFDEAEFVAIDEGSRKNLEIVRNLGDAGRAFSLISVLDFTKTAPGSRLLRQWLLQPLRSREAIEERLAAVEFLYRDQRLLGSLREALGGMRDIERLASRAAMDKAHAKDLLALGASIRACAAARELLVAAGAPARLSAGPGPEALAEALGAAELAERAIKEEPSTLLTEGDLIKEGYDLELDRLCALKSDSRRVLEDYVEEERRASGIPTLKLRFNRIIGYYLEVSKGKLDSVPQHFRRRQSLVTGERFSTERLAALEAEIDGATERIVELERRLFLAVRDRVKAAVPAVIALGRAAAAQDCLASFAQAATARGFTRPRISEEPILRISEGRHPVVEAHLPPGSFVPNGIELVASVGSDDSGEARQPRSRAEGEAFSIASGEARQPRSRAEGEAFSIASGEAAGAGAFALITGPNMAGKSTFLRQTALITLMAQAGSYVPAMDAEIGLVDKIFCRVGAQDSLARGESTFLVEMHETAYILNTASSRSLVLMDEVGRGTSTIDGLAIAWAVAERLLDGVGCRTLFATHFHELTAIEHPRLRNLSLAVLEEEGEIVFLKRIEPGPAAGSYGIHVAKLAGIPPEVLDRAERIRVALADKERELPAPAEKKEGRGKPRVSWGGHPVPPEAQAGLFGPGELVLAELASVEPDRLTPLEALNKLASLKRRLQSGL